MRLCELLPAVEDGVLLQGDPRTEVRGLCYDCLLYTSRCV